MDAHRFDRIAKTLSTSGSRRRVLGGLLGGTLGGLLARLDPEEAAATHTGCRHNGTRCSRPGQCCSGWCAGDNTCQPCTRVGQCPAPPASEPCKKRVCTSTGKCALQNKVAGSACLDDGNACTIDMCNESGECTHRNRTGEACTTSPCEASTCSCQDSTCAPCTPSATPCSHASPETCCSAICASAHQVPGCPPGVDTCCV